MLNGFFTLAVRTLQEPRTVADELISMRIERRVLWLALALVVVLNTLIYQLSLVIAPPLQELPFIFTSPVPFAVIVGSGLVLSIYSITYAGRFLGGKASLNDIMVLLVWLQYLRFAVQVLMVVLMPIASGIAGLLVFAASLYGIWLVLQFVDVAHRFDSLFTSFGTLVFSVLGIMLGVAILLSLLGIQNLGLTPYV
ncbi:hypothetical protein ACH42_03770 [Endozoicomonas sp. (ex Bugula neritina AB1)]|nr:hypothetical protein ACH42_03770 [Endozoicomonas sp. (ex Bugula neritina AB1)]